MKLTRSLRSLALIGILTVWLGVAGCSKITRDNYDKIQVGMSLVEVQKILGETQEKSGGGMSLGAVEVSGETLIWRDDKRTITIVFLNKQVMLKSEVGL